MASKSRFRRQTAFQVSMAVCVIFVVLTAVAMLLYPGGTKTDHSTPGYSFFQNFFSDLGLTKAWSGESNSLSSVLFIVALSLAGAMLALFFVAFAQFFNQSFRGKLLSRLGSVAGVISGICFVGIAEAAGLGICAVCYLIGSLCGTDHRRPIIGDAQRLEDSGNGTEDHCLCRHREHLHPGQRGAEIRPVNVASRRTCRSTEAVRTSSLSREAPTLHG